MEDSLLLCGKYKNKKFSEITDEGYCKWVLTLDDCAGSLADFKKWLRRNSLTSAQDSASRPAAKRSRISAWLEDSLGEELEELDSKLEQPAATQRGGSLPPPNRNMPASITGPNDRIIYDGLLLFEVCSNKHFRVIGKLSGQKRFSTFLPRNLFDILNGYRDRKEVGSLVFGHGDYDKVLKLLREKVSTSGKKGAGGEIESIPTFVMLCFDGLRKFATRTQLAVKCANILCGINSPISKSIEINAMKARVGIPLLKNLKGFQREGLAWGLSKNGRCLIGDEMGLGKTLQALAIIALYQDEWPALIVCPSSIRFQWKDQAKLWLSHLFEYPDDQIIVVNNGKVKINNHTAKLIITSYDLLVRSDTLKTGYRVIVCDESHYLKCPTAKRSRTLVPMLQAAKRAILLSGTPALNKPVELYQQMTALLPDFTDYKKFAERYCDKKKNPWSAKFDYFGARLNDELNVLLRNTVMIRRLKKDVEMELPQKLRSRVPLIIPPQKLELITMKIASMGKTGNSSGGGGGGGGGGSGGGSFDDGWLGSDGGESDKSKQIKISELFKMTGEFKAESVCEYINDMLGILQPAAESTSDAGKGASRKVIVFGHHHSVLDMIEFTCLKGRRFVRIDGRTPISSRETLVKKFQETDEADIALLSITACGHGLNLTKAEVGIFAELYWVPGQIMQAEDRLHRIGSEHKCINIYYCLAEKTLDDIVWNILVKKWRDVSTTLNGEKEEWGEVVVADGA